MKIIVIAFWLVALPVTIADTLTLTTGETVTGVITEESATEYRVRVANDDYSITHLRIVPTNEVRAVTRDTPAQRAERIACEAFCAYRLHPDREQPATRCHEAIAAFEDFLSRYPHAATRPRVTAQLRAWRDELAQVSAGFVKYQNQWLPPAAKSDALRAAARQAQHRNLQQRAQNLRQQISLAEAARRRAHDNLLATATQLAAAQEALQALRDSVEPVYQYEPVGGPPRFFFHDGRITTWSPPLWERYVIGHRVVVHPARAATEQRVLNCEHALRRYRTELTDLDQQLADLRAELAKVEAAPGP